MKKKTLILDLDGTLYYQLGVQMIMGIRLLCYYVFHFWKFKELLALKKYRSIREKNQKNIVNKQFKIIAQEYNMSIDRVEAIVKTWMFDKPLSAIKLFKDKKLLKLISEYKQNGGKVFIYSDYPTEQKLQVLEIKYDKSYSSTDEHIQVLKPDSKGLEYIINSNKLKKAEILFIGDRDSKDGACARACNIDYIILPKIGRNKKYKLIKQKI